MGFRGFQKSIVGGLWQPVAREILAPKEEMLQSSKLGGSNIRVLQARGQPVLRRRKKRQCSNLAINRIDSAPVFDARAIIIVRFKFALCKAVPAAADQWNKVFILLR